MAFDYKKEYRKFYLPTNTPHIVEIPNMKYLAVRGKGNPNQENGEYQTALSLLYAVAYTIRMSSKKNHSIEGFFEYVVPPLEGFWWQEGKKELSIHEKDSFHWISCIHLPDFVTKEVFDWAKQEATKQKNLDCSKVEYLYIEEGTCVQCMHIGSYNEEEKTITNMHHFIEQQGYESDCNDTRLHHEIYLSDPRKCQPDRLKTVIRIPIKEVSYE